MSIKSNQKIHVFDPENWTENYSDLLLQIAISRINDHQTAEDLVQDTFLAAWKSRANFRGDCSEKTYLCGILKNKVIDYYRSKGRKPTLIASQINHNESEDTQTDWLERRPDQSPDNDPSLVANRGEFSSALDTAVEKLPVKMRDVFRLWMIENLSTAEVTKRLGISESNLWVSIHRAKKLLRAELESDWSSTSLTPV